MKTLLLLTILSFPDDSQKKHMAISAFASASLMIPCASITSQPITCAILSGTLVNLVGLLKETGIASEDTQFDRKDLLANTLGSLVVVPLYFAF